MWNLAVPVSEIALRSVCVYGFVLLGLRLAGKREVGQMTPFDLVLLLLISNAVQNAMMGPDTSLGGGLLAAGFLLILNRIFSMLASHSRFLARVLKGHATVLVNRGVLIDDNLHREGMTQDELMTALREHGVPGVGDVRLAVLEIDGSISVVRNEDVQNQKRPKRHVRILKHE